MRIIDLTPLNYYTCLQCYILFISETEQVLFWFCSTKCQYKFAFAICRKSFPDAKNEDLFKLTKKVVEVSLNAS